MDSLATLLAHPVVGNHAGDYALIQRLEAFVESDAPLTDRVAALQHLATSVLGLGPDPWSDAAVVTTYLKGE